MLKYITELVDDKQLRQSVALQNLTQFERLYSWSVTLEQLREVYTKYIRLT